MFTRLPSLSGRVAGGFAIRSSSAGSALLLCALPALAEPVLWPGADRGYDPVGHALALGLTPERMDAAFDRRLAEAERCPRGAETLATGGCGPVTPVEKLPPTS